jgi:hypothetical protein
LLEALPVRLFHFLIAGNKSHGSPSIPIGWWMSECGEYSHTREWKTKIFTAPTLTFEQEIRLPDLGESAFYCAIFSTSQYVLFRMVLSALSVYMVTTQYSRIPLSPLDCVFLSANVFFSVADPWHFGTDLDTQNRAFDFAIFVSYLQDDKKMLSLSFFAYYFLKVHLHRFSKIKSHRFHKTVGIKVFLINLAW